jgi:hypothetical protein
VLIGEEHGRDRRGDDEESRGREAHRRIFVDAAGRGSNEGSTRCTPAPMRDT